MDIFTSFFTSGSPFGKRKVSSPKSPNPSKKKNTLLHETNITKLDLPYKPMGSPRENKKNKK
jgi:hypothetical protein|tara:strand:+ start:252 stop:437 length:186 start_codon:yes stop_codon:yes gene_type:complete